MTQEGEDRVAQYIPTIDERLANIETDLVSLMSELLVLSIELGEIKHEQRLENAP
jgi:hypothetical protein